MSRLEISDLRLQSARVTLKQSRPDQSRGDVAALAARGSSLLMPVRRIPFGGASPSDRTHRQSQQHPRGTNALD